MPQEMNLSGIRLVRLEMRIPIFLMNTSYEKALNSSINDALLSKLLPVRGQHTAKKHRTFPVLFRW